MKKEPINLSVKYGEAKMSKDYLNEHQHASLKKLFVKPNDNKYFLKST